MEPEAATGTRAAIYSVWSLLKTLNQGSRLICHALIFNQPNLNPLDLKTSRILEGTSEILIVHYMQIALSTCVIPLFSLLPIPHSENIKCVSSIQLWGISAPPQPLGARGDCNCVHERRTS